MAQGAIDVSGEQPGNGYSAAMRAGLAAIATGFAGTTAPAASGQPFGNQQWLDLTTGLWKRRNNAGTAWVCEGVQDAPLQNALCTGLQITPADASAAVVTSVSVTWAALTVGGTYCKTPGSPLTLSTAAGTGAGKIDTGAWATGTWYGLDVICSYDAALVALVASAAGDSAPTLPSGYDRWRRIGWLRTSGSTATDLLAVSQEGPWATWVGDVNTTLLSAGTATTFTDVDCSTQVPPNARDALLSCVTESDGSLAGGTTRDARLRRNGSTASTGRRVGRVKGANQAQLADVLMPLDASRVCEYLVSGANSSLSIYGAGWFDRGVA